MSNALEQASLIMVPSGYEDGTLGSLKPTDGSGDFTFSRGSDISATRVNADGYIEKGYENLLLQSNSFDTTWTKSAVNVTGGQVGYDGTNNAWLLEAFASTSARVEQPISSNVSTLTIYAKAGTTNWMFLNGGTGGSVYFDLENGVVGAASSQNIDNSITSISNGWYKITSVVSSTTHFRVYPATSNGSLATTGDNIYIQDAMLNQGLVAYPYIETTTAPVAGGILEDMPRLDYSNGSCPALLLEPQRTNLVPHSEYLNIMPKTNCVVTSNSILSPEGVLNASKFEGQGNSNFIRARQVVTLPAAGTYCFSIYVKAGTSINMSIIIANYTATGNTTADFVLTGNGSTTSSDATIELVGNEWYRCSVYPIMDGVDLTGNFYVYVADSSGSLFYSSNGDTLGRSLYFYGMQVEQDATYPTSYIPTYGTSQTRSNEVISDNFNIPTTATIYNSFYSDVAETVFVFDQVFNVVEGLNKVAIAFSPTAVKISVGGSIVANATGTYDTTSLTNIQLGSNNGTDYSNAPISGFYTFPEFLTDEELNSLTD